jgi:GNAT superfamily N-acetyltransferase
MKTDVTTYYMEMSSPEEHRPGSSRPVDFELKQVKIPCPEFNRFFYSAIGGDWFWLDRLPWTYEQWRTYVTRPEIQTWCGYSAGTPVGYFELELLPETGVEIVYFGLLPQFVGKGLGGALLTSAIQQAWALEPHRVWVHTCTLDHPGALSNYQARGFRLYKQETKAENLPEKTPGPWPGAR